MITRLLAQVAPDTVGIVSADNSLRPITQLKPSFYLTSVLNILLGGAGVFSFIYLLWGGIQWITAGGDKDAVEKARKKIIGALIGLAIVFSAYAILFAVRTLFNVNLIEVPLRPLGSVTAGAPGGPGGPGGPAGNGLCGGCITGGCGFTGDVYQGAGGVHYLCSATGWISTGAAITSTTCGTCP